MVLFKDRLGAGKQLAKQLKKYKEKKDCIILAIPRGGVAVGYGLAKELKIPLGIIVARKLPIPWDPEAGFGAIVNDEVVLNEQLVARLGLSKDEINSIVKMVKAELKRRRSVYDKRFELDIKNKIVIIVDDGLASGFTMLAALKYIKKKRPKKIIVAVPTASFAAIKELEKKLGKDKIIALKISYEPIFAVADSYKEFPDLSDEEVTKYLESVKKRSKIKKIK